MLTVTTILMVIAVILLLAAAINWPAQTPVAMGWLGLFFWALTHLVGGFK